MVRTLLAGSPDDFMMVHHLVLRGDEGQIGRALAAEAMATFGWTPPPQFDPPRARARRRWFARHWPQHYGRMAGIAGVTGRDIDDDTVDLATLFAAPMPEGPMPTLCSAAWTRAGDRPRVGRNLDFFTGTLHEMLGGDAQPGERPLFSRPYVVETHPDDAYAAIIIVLGDLTGCLDGINEHGLVVALNADDESGRTAGGQPHPSLTPQAGLNEMHVLRFLLETCATAAEAKDALYRTKQYDEYAVAHYLIADAEQAFVWEREGHNAEHAVDADGDTLCVTNHPLHRSIGPSVVADVGALDAVAGNTYARLRILLERLQGEPASDEVLWDTLEAARFDARSARNWCNPGEHTRTLWHSQYDIEARSVVFEFYLGEDADGSPRRSPPVTLMLAS